jgi:signal transduction histidine kinase
MAQNNTIDSLKVTLSKHTDYTTSLYLNTLSQLANQLYAFQADSAIFYAKKLEEEGFKAGDTKIQAEGLKLQGSINRVRGEYDLALEIYDKSYQIYLEINAQKEIAEILNEIGLIHNHKGDYVKALRYYYLSLKIAEEINDLSVIAANFNTIAGVHINQKDVNKALHFFKKSLEVNIKARNKQAMARSLHNMGEIYSEQKQYDKALVFFYKTLEIEKEIESRLIGIETIFNIGQVHLQKGEYDKALSFFEKSNELAFQVNNDLIKLYTYKGIAKVYYEKKIYSESIKYALKGLELTQKVNMLLLVRDLSQILYENYKAQENYQKALEYYELYKQSNDSVFDVEKTKTINNLEVKNETEHKEKEIVILSKDKAILKTEKEFQQKIIYLIIFSLLLMVILTYFIYQSRRKEQKAIKIISVQNQQLKERTEEIQLQATNLAQINADKDRLFAIIGHDLRSPINSLTGMLSLLEDKLISQEEFLFFSGRLKGNVAHVHFTLNNLLLWANNQMQGIHSKPEAFDIYNVAKENINFLAATAENKKIRIINEISLETFVFADIDQIKLVFRNLISNAIKFTLSEGDIRIYAQIKDTQLEIAIEDDGVGIPVQKLETIFRDSGVSTLGTQQEKGTGLGLLLCKDFVESNGGEIWVESEEGKGSTFYFSLPIKVEKKLNQ